MSTLTLEEFDARLAAALKVCDGAAAVAMLSCDPLARFARGFNRQMEGVDADGIAAAYAGPQAVLAARVAGGRVPDADTFFRLLAGIQARTGQKLRGRAGRRADPRVRSSRRAGGGSRPLFAPGGADPDRQAGR